jgi:hypothetical protein
LHSATNATTIGIAWYRREDYPELRGIMEDAHVLPLTYDGWLRLAVAIVRLAHSRGCRVVKTAIEPETFSAWCRATGQRPDVSARTQFVNLEVENYCSMVEASEAKRDEVLDERRKGTSLRPWAA